MNSKKSKIEPSEPGDIKYAVILLRRMLQVITRLLEEQDITRIFHVSHMRRDIVALDLGKV